MTTDADKWNQGDKMLHPDLGEGIIEEIHYWDTKKESCLSIKYGRNSTIGASADQEYFEKQGWTLQS